MIHSCRTGRAHVSATASVRDATPRLGYSSRGRVLIVFSEMESRAPISRREGRLRGTAARRARPRWFLDNVTAFGICSGSGEVLLDGARESKPKVCERHRPGSGLESFAREADRVASPRLRALVCSLGTSQADLARGF